MGALRTQAEPKYSEHTERRGQMKAPDLNTPRLHERDRRGRNRESGESGESDGVFRRRRATRERGGRPMSDVHPPLCGAIPIGTGVSRNRPHDSLHSARLASFFGMECPRDDVGPQGLNLSLNPWHTDCEQTGCHRLSAGTPTKNDHENLSDHRSPRLAVLLL